MSHQIALAFEDGVTRFIECAEDQTVADASYRARINIPLDCRDGACGTCKAFCESGTYDGGDYIDDALTADEAERGFVLPCSMKPRSALVLQIATTSAIAKTTAASYAATVVSIEKLSPTTVALTVAIANRGALAFLPGQYVNVAVPGTDQVRSYSFSTSPDSDELSFLVKLTPGGAMSTYLVERAAVGDPIAFAGPHGSFFLRPSDQPLLLLAGGTGLAPMLSILRRLKEEGSRRPVHLLYGVSTDRDLVELETLAGLAHDLDLTWQYCVSDRASTAQNVGYLTALIDEQHHQNGAAAVYLCGPPRMVEAVRQHFIAEDITPVGFHFEKFAVSGTGSTAVELVILPAATPEPELSTPTEEPVDEMQFDQEDDMTTSPEPTPTLGSRRIAGQLVLREADDRQPLHSVGGVIHAPARAIAGQAIFATSHVEPLHVVEEGPKPQPTARRTAFLSPGRFDGKVVLLTGGAQGIGERAARRISSEGGILVVADRSDLVHEVVDSMRAGGPEALAVVADLEGWEGAESAVRAAIERFGRIDVAIHAVGGTIWQKPFYEYPPEQIEAEIARSLYPTLWGCRAVAPHMVAAGAGTIINVSSTATRGIFRVPYSAAKGGINALTASLALELAPYGIRVAATAPGGTDAPPRRIPRGPRPESETELQWQQQMIAQVVDSTLVKRYGTLDEQASAIAFLASDEASYITGTVLPVAGGDLG